jgi:hypothetical protein
MTQRVRKAIFPVAGLGTRLLPATKSIPKEMITIVDRPLIQYAVDEAREAGIEQLIFVTGRGKSALVDYFDMAFELETTMRGKGKSLDPLEPSRANFGELVERRQFLDAGRAPGRPQVHDHRSAPEVGKADIAAVGIVEDGVRRGLALVAAVDALDRAGLCRGLGLVLSLRSRFLAGSKGEEDQGDREDAHGERR